MNRFAPSASAIIFALMLLSVAVVFMAPSVGAIKESTTQAVRAYSTGTNVPGDAVRKSLGFTEMAVTAVGDLSSLSPVHINVAYDSESPTILLSTTAKLYFTKDGSLPTTASPVMTMQAERTQGQQVPQQIQNYAGSLTVAELAGGHRLRFVIEIYQASGGSDIVFACDVGRAGTTGATGTAPRTSFLTGACPGASTQFREYGFFVSLDGSLPVVTIRLVTKGSNATINQHLALSDPSFGFNVTIQDSNVVSSTAYAAPLVHSSITVTMSNSTATPLGGPLTYLSLANNRTAFTPAQADRDGYRNTTTSYFRFLQLNRLVQPWNATVPNKIWTITVGAKDAAENRVSTTFKFIQDTGRPQPTVFSATASPSVTGEEGTPPAAVVFTGVGATARVKVTVADGQNAFHNHVDRTASNSTSTNPAVKAQLFSTDRPAFASTLEALKFNSSSGKYEGDIKIQDATTAIPNDATPFFVKVKTFIIDAAGNKNLDDASAVSGNLFKVKPGLPTLTAPTIESKLIPVNPTIARGGPYNVTVTASDPDKIRMFKLRVYVTNGTFATATGWTKINDNKYENSTTYTDAQLQTSITRKFVIPNQAATARMYYEAEAQDTLGNLANTSISANRSLSVDRTPPQVLEPGKKDWRNLGPESFVFGLLDLGGADVNATTSGKMSYRIKGTTAYASTNLTVAGNLASATINITGTHKQVVEYYAYKHDRVGNNGTYGTSAAPKNYTIDLVKPTTTLDPTPANSLDGKFVLTALATDADSGISKVVFEGRSKSLTGTFGDFVVLGNSSARAFGPLCLAPGTTYEFRAFSIDNATNVGDRSDVRATTVTGNGCVEELVASIRQPTPGAIVDAQGGTHKYEIKYNAGSSATFTAAAFVRVRLEFSPDDGAHWRTLVADSPNTGSYNWTVNEPTCDRCLLRINASLPGGKSVMATSANFEVINGNPTTDYDANGLYDECELRYFRAIGARAANDDSDGDGLRNQQECGLGTNPANPDTDGDGATDGTEFKLGRDALDPNDKPTVTEMRFEQWDAYYALVAVIFIAIVAVFLLGLARRW